MASLKGASNALSHNVVLICAGMRFERDRGSRSVSDNAWPGSEEAGSNGRQVHSRRRTESWGNGTELASYEIYRHRRLQMDGRRLRRDLLGSTPHGRKEIYGNFLHLLRSDCQDLPISRS